MYIGVPVPLNKILLMQWSEHVWHVLGILLMRGASPLMRSRVFHSMWGLYKHTVTPQTLSRLQSGMPFSLLFPDFWIFVSVQYKFEIHSSVFKIIILTFYSIPMPIISIVNAKRTFQELTLGLALICAF